LKITNRIVKILTLLVATTILRSQMSGFGDRNMPTMLKLVAIACKGQPGPRGGCGTQDLDSSSGDGHSTLGSMHEMDWNHGS
jgi:hypothetical protein